MEREGWNRRYEGTELLWTGAPNRLLVSEVATMPPGRTLDLGAGEGRNAVWLATEGWKVTGVDFSDVGLEKARRLAEAGGVEVEWVLADLRTYAPENSVYDLAIALYLHLPAPERRTVLSAAARGLATGGTLLVLGHDVTNLEQGHGGPQEKSILFTPEDVIADVPELFIEKAERVTRSVPTETGEKKAIDALVRAGRR